MTPEGNPPEEGGIPPTTGMDSGPAPLRPALESSVASTIPPKLKGLLLIAGACALLVGAGTMVGFQIRKAKRAKKLAVFGPHLAEYLKPTAPAVQEGRAHRIGKVVVIDLRSKQIDEGVYFELPESTRATHPTEVGSVVWLDRGEEIIGTYEDGVPARALTCKITVIDLAKWCITAEEVIRGPNLPQKRKASESGSSDPVPDWLIAPYLTGLPER